MAVHYTFLYSQSSPPGRLSRAVLTMLRVATFKSMRFSSFPSSYTTDVSLEGESNLFRSYHNYA
jgi:hypothetical protein